MVNRKILIGATVIAMLTLSAGVAWADEVTSEINYQGRLADSAGGPLSGTYEMTFRLYDVLSGGTVLDTDAHSVGVENGLFNTEINFDRRYFYYFNGSYFNSSYFDGRELWLGITVGTDSEMTPRQELRPVPYALSLVPGAVISGSLSCPVLEVNTDGVDSYGVYARTYGDGSEGFYARTYGDNSGGVYARTHGVNSKGVYARTAGDHSGGVYAETYGDNSEGVYAYTEGVNSDGVYAETTGEDSDGVYAVSTKGYGVNAKGKKAGIYAEGILGGYAAEFDGNVIIRAGRTITPVLEITGGSDLSEQFEIRGIEAEISPSPGMVVSIDPERPGELVVSNNAYDWRVAGIISGAGGLSPGMLMGQNGSDADGGYPVALSGRVYCWADASNGPIEPGDLLTTSETPGHAIKVTDHDRAHGAIIGKAMTGIEEGKGLVLVLVALH